MSVEGLFSSLISKGAYTFVSFPRGPPPPFPFPIRIQVSRPVDQLYGHLSPRYVFEELRYLASLLNSPLAKEAVVLEKEHETTLGVNGRGHGEDEIACDGLKAKRTRMNGHGEPNLEGRLKGINGELSFSLPYRSDWLFRSSRRN